MFGIDPSQSRKDVSISINPIKSLNPFQTSWTIKGHVTMKKEIHRYTNQKGSGQVFSFDIIDSEHTKTRVTCFNEAIDIHYANINIGSIYSLFGGTIKSANKLYNKLNSGIEITLMVE